MTRDEHRPYERDDELPTRELGDWASDSTEPEHGDAEAREPELDRLDLEADEPAPGDENALDDDNPVGGVL